MRLLAGLAAAVVVYLGLGLALGVRPTARPKGTWRNRAQQLAESRFGPGRFMAWLAQADAPVRPGQFVAVALSLGAVGAVLATVATGVAAFGLLACVAGLATPVLVVGQRRSRLLTGRQAAWPDALRDLSTHLRAGMAAHAGLGELAVTGPLPLRPVFGRYRMLASAIDQRAALETVRAELADPVSDRIIEILLVGLAQGPFVVVDLLDDLARSTTEDLRLVEDIRTAQLETKLEARGAVALPFVVLALLCATSADYRAFYQSPLGWLVICGGGLLSLAGLVVIRQLGHTPTEERVLTGRLS